MKTRRTLVPILALLAVGLFACFTNPTVDVNGTYGIDGPWSSLTIDLVTSFPSTSFTGAYHLTTRMGDCDAEIAGTIDGRNELSFQVANCFPGLTTPGVDGLYVCTAVDTNADTVADRLDCGTFADQVADPPFPLTRR